jgi:hypothetical protein
MKGLNERYLALEAKGLRPGEPGGSRVDPPWVPIESRWEYKELVRDAEGTELPTEAELNTLGADGWELASAVREGPRVHFYFKRERVR